MDGAYTLVAFGEEVFIYERVTAETMAGGQEMAALGSFQLEHTVIAIQNVPYSDNYYILTEGEVVMAYIKGKDTKTHHKSAIMSVSSRSKLTYRPV